MGADQRERRGRPRSVSNALARWIDKSKLNRNQVAKRLGISRAHLDRLCADRRRPDLETAFAIEDITRGKVTARSWLGVPQHASDNND